MTLTFSSVIFISRPPIQELRYYFTVYTTPSSPSPLSIHPLRTSPNHHSTSIALQHHQHRHQTSLIIQYQHQRHIKPDLSTLAPPPPEGIYQYLQESRPTSNVTSASAAVSRYDYDTPSPLYPALHQSNKLPSATQSWLLSTTTTTIASPFSSRTHGMFKCTSRWWNLKILL